MKNTGWCKLLTCFTFSSAYEIMQQEIENAPLMFYQHAKSWVAVDVVFIVALLVYCYALVCTE